jgi:hypothetical protein
MPTHPTNERVELMRHQKKEKQDQQLRLDKREVVDDDALIAT